MSQKLCELSQGLVRHRCTSFQWAMCTIAKGSKHKAPLMDSIKDRAQSGEKNTNGAQRPHRDSLPNCTLIPSFKYLP